MNRKVKVKLPNGQIIERVPHAKQLGNWVNMFIRYRGEDYWIGDGDEYLRGAPDVFELGALKSGE